MRQQQSYQQPVAGENGQLSAQREENFKNWPSPIQEQNGKNKRAASEATSISQQDKQNLCAPTNPSTPAKAATEQTDGRKLTFPSHWPNESLIKQSKILNSHHSEKPRAFQ